MTEQNNFLAQQDFILRFSKKAKRAIIYVKAQNLIEIALPIYFKQKQYDTNQLAQNLLKKHQDWIIKKIKHLNKLNLENIPDFEKEKKSKLLPTEIILKATNEKIKVTYRQSNRVAAYCLFEVSENSEFSHELNINIKNIQNNNEAFCEPEQLSQEETQIALKQLQTWVKDYAERKLEIQTNTLAQIFNLKVAKVKTKLQKTRLGSCTSKGVINLNAALLFFPPELTKHLILHELAHLKEMNHSQAFWRFLYTMDQNCFENDKKLKKQLRLVPFWVFAKKQI
ncbi:M48 family metallopeptidase [Desulfovibrio litoralis]|uniref:YgjP-like metallopeptidase domain-containing protein n=1 Tax=Desulfovibrio litoralis DSM 11393 TaxID=1121455 RepID=A0A1M7TK41_9BACT|nr:YgjP-like metallopeptidase domain-containing protein [Desulfovibrio litoralis]SHN71066.1 Protein of unknown function DUF45 [Desulfovibrio litoralis DSM 11393]